MIQTDEYVEKAEVLKAMGHPIRLAIAALLLKQGNANVTTIYTALDLPQSTVSLHLNRLKSGRVVKGTRHGLEIYYEILNDRIRETLKVFL
ncbi:ArsR/SmtB family transcription factor [Ectobacillus ponti]|uniref:Metalloregulator ArsR/SmtB family transcription factor n=1 Tax=Ectobacillus ponti TaxID=2961894 RepID=A0AA41X7P1_9BACI|nr:metalloregulator ArsR/SmtB family transcription factor [Ectobacillus ponti]MCP8967808.1 metalloregulator ArsR/SmtB family transcription factor [Ectobacillus ponti]